MEARLLWIPVALLICVHLTVQIGAQTCRDPCHLGYTCAMVRKGNGPPRPGCIDMQEALLLQQAMNGAAHGPGWGMRSRQHNPAPPVMQQTVIPQQTGNPQQPIIPPHVHLPQGGIIPHTHLPQRGVRTFFPSPSSLLAAPLNDIMQLRETIPGPDTLGITPISASRNIRGFERFRRRNRIIGHAPERIIPTFRTMTIAPHTHDHPGSSVRRGSFSGPTNRRGGHIVPRSDTGNDWSMIGSLSGMDLLDPISSGPVRATLQPWPAMGPIADTRVHNGHSHQGGSPRNSGSFDPSSATNQDISSELLDLIADNSGSQTGFVEEPMPTTSGPDTWNQPDVGQSQRDWNVQHTTQPPPFSQDTKPSQTGKEASTIISDDTGIYYFYYQSNNTHGTRVNVTKEGFCRRYAKTTESNICVMMCYSDRQCPRSLKCCPNGCSLSCIRPFIPDLPPNPGHVVDAANQNSMNSGTDCTPCQTNADCDGRFCYFKPSCAKKTCQILHE